MSHEEVYDELPPWEEMAENLDRDDFDDEEPLPELPPLEPVEPLPLVNAGTLVMRDYQIEAVQGIYEQLRDHRSTLAVLATGLGKTVIAAEVALLWPEQHGRVLFLAHRKELIEQAAKSIGLHIDEACGIEMGQQSEARHGRSLHGLGKVLVGSVQTLCRLNRLKPYKPEDFGLIITDESHHATANSYKTIFGWFQQNPQCRFLGITATPDRADEQKLGEVFETVAHKMDIIDGIEGGWLVPIEQRYVVIEGLDFASVRTTAGDLNDRDLERAMAGANSDEIGDDDEDLTEDQVEARKKQEKMLHAVADPTIREANGRAGIVFCVTIDHAEKMAAVFRRYGVTAEAVTQNTTPDMRAEHIASFKKGTLQFLIGVGVFTEGFDAPNAAVIAVARPTKSRSLYTQMIGRATRPDPDAVNGIHEAWERIARIAASNKPSATVLDFVGNSGKHKLISTADILGDAFPEDLRAEVVEAMRRLGTKGDVRKEMADLQARKELMKRLAKEEEEKKREADRLRYEETLKRIQEERRLRNLKAEAQYRTRDVDPFGHKATHQPGQTQFRGGASEAQIALLEKLGVKHETALSYTKGQAGAVITELKSRVGGKFRITFGKHKGKSLAEAGSGFVWWIENQMEDGDLKNTLQKHIDLMRLESKGINPGNENTF